MTRSSVTRAEISGVPGDTPSLTPIESPSARGVGGRSPTLTPALALNRYASVLSAVLSAGEVDAVTRKRLQRYRELCSVGEDEHSHVLATNGWSAAQYAHATSRTHSHPSHTSLTQRSCRLALAPASPSSAPAPASAPLHERSTNPNPEPGPTQVRARYQ